MSNGRFKSGDRVLCTNIDGGGGTSICCLKQNSKYKVKHISPDEYVYLEKHSDCVCSNGGNTIIKDACGGWDDTRFVKIIELKIGVPLSFNAKKKCECGIDILMNQGCQCGGE